MLILLFLVFTLTVGLILILNNTKCTRDCTNKNCGSDGCSGICGTCKNDENCDNGKCVSHKGCVPKCTNKNCGSDGCSGICGTCKNDENCDNGKCVSNKGCVPNCSGELICQKSKCVSKPLDFPSNNYYYAEMYSTLKDVYAETYIVPMSDDYKRFYVYQKCTDNYGRVCFSKAYYQLSSGQLAPYIPDVGEKNDQYIICNNTSSGRYPPFSLSTGGSVKDFKIGQSFILDRGGTLPSVTFKYKSV
jgi:hypothetical protein